MQFVTEAKMKRGSAQSKHKCSTEYCKNCNNEGHANSSCRHPITSIGVIVARTNAATSELELLMIRRKDTYGYVDFLRGKTPFNDIGKMEICIDEMSLREKAAILSIRTPDDVRELRIKMWGSFKIQYRREEEDACRKILGFIRTNALDCSTDRPTVVSTVSTVVSTVSTDRPTNVSTVSTDTAETSKYTLADIVLMSSTKWENPEWGFPKGKREYHENDIRCALREFEEETGISRDRIDVIQNIVPIEEVFVGTDGRPYKHKYFVACLKGDSVDLSKFQTSEVGGVEWKSIARAVDSIRPNNPEKVDVIRQVDDMFKKYRVI